MARQRLKIRQTRTRRYPAGSGITRPQAVAEVSRLLQKGPPSAYALDLITLFELSGEELAEAGVSYEALKSLQRAYPWLH